MLTPADTMSSSRKYSAKLKSLKILYCTIIQLRTRFGIYGTTLFYVPTMVLLPATKSFNFFNFAGLTITNDGVAPSENILTPIPNFPTPTSKVSKSGFMSIFYQPFDATTDWSKNGIGYLLLQQHCKYDSDKIPTCCETGWQLILAGPRFTNPAESHYSSTEGEALALVWFLHHSRMFTQGCKRSVVSADHKPYWAFLITAN